MAGSLLLLSNPRKRKSVRKARKTARKASRRVKRKTSFRFKARSNPFPSVSGVVPTLKLAAAGTIGALANDVAFGFVRPKLPAALQSDVAVGGLKILSALAIGFIANKVKAGSGRALAIGAATCALHDAARNIIIAKAPNSMGEYVAMGSIGEYYFAPNSVGEYVGDYPSTAVPVGDTIGVGDSGYDNS